MQARRCSASNPANETIKAKARNAVCMYKPRGLVQKHILIIWFAQGAWTCAKETSKLHAPSSCSAASCLWSCFLNGCKRIQKTCNSQGSNCFPTHKSCAHTGRHPETVSRVANKTTTPPDPSLNRLLSKSGLSKPFPLKALRILTLYKTPKQSQKGRTLQGRVILFYSRCFEVRFPATVSFGRVVKFLAVRVKGGLSEIRSQANSWPLAKIN